MASSNPFRRSVLQAKAADSTLPPLEPIDATQTHAAPPRTSFREPEPSDADDEPEPEPKPQHDRKQKPVKKVRVLTPPPLSPDSPEWPEVEPMYRTGAGLVPPPVDYDPFAGSATDESDRDGVATPPYTGVAASAYATTPSAPGGPPANPFSRTLQDVEGASSKEELDLQQREEGEVLKAANAGTPALNVDAFKRLLLTGNSGLQDRQASADDQGLASLNAEANKIVASPPQGAQEHSEIHGIRGNSQQGQRVVVPSESSKDKKLAPPPPPNSRHGKTIKSEQLKESEHHHYAPSETKTALPLHIPRGNESESTLDDSSSIDSHANEAAAPSSTRKSAPVPPPRRGHARSDSKSTLPSISSSRPSEDDHEPRSSIDSTHRQDSEKPRGHNIPAPPPPRRPHATPKQSGSTTASSSSIPQRNPPETSPISGRSPVPPRPPARNPSSARRLPGGSGGGGGGASSSVDRRDSAPPPQQPPPPPPPRHRGSSSPTRKSSAERSGKPPVDSSKGADILADLDALRREVEALRGAR